MNSNETSTLHTPEGDAASRETAGSCTANVHAAAARAADDFAARTPTPGISAPSAPRPNFPTRQFAAAHTRAHAPSSIEGVIFDLDGTLLDSMPWWEGLGENYLIARGKTPEPDIRVHFKRLTLEGSARYMQQTYGLTESVEEIARGIMAGIDNAYRTEIPLKPGVASALEQLASAGVAMCVATASERDVVEAALERLGIAHYFSALFTCGEVGASKTEPLIFEMALAHLGTRREATLVMEDSLHAIETAHAAGFPTCAIAEPTSADDLPAILKLADFYIESFEGIKP